MEVSMYKPSKKYIHNDWGYLFVENFFIFLIGTVTVFLGPWMLLQSNSKNWIADPYDMSDPLALVVAKPYIWVVISIVLGLLITLYFIIKKVRKKEITYVRFDDHEKKVIIGVRKYFDKGDTAKEISYSDLNFSHEIKKRAGQRGYKFKIEFFKNKDMIVELNSAASIWQLRRDQEQLGAIINKLKRVSRAS
ncbi:MAG: hypothetical protein HKN92_03450 [Chitinophagales bacterium]|nr:hypothetical protein [Chitinophagales bacterium]